MSLGSESTDSYASEVLNKLRTAIEGRQQDDGSMKSIALLEEITDWRSIGRGGPDKIRRVCGTISQIDPSSRSGSYSDLAKQYLKVTAGGFDNEA
jgi:hypothetical protein